MYLLTDYNINLRFNKKYHQLSKPTEAIKTIVSFVGLQPCERSDKPVEGKNSHTLLLAGLFRGGHDVMVRAKLALDDGVSMLMTVRSTNANVSQVIASAIS